MTAALDVTAVAAAAVGVVVEQWAPASPRTASIFVGVHSGDGSVGQSRLYRSPLPAADWAADMPLHTPRGASGSGGYSLLVERFLLQFTRWWWCRGIKG